MRIECKASELHDRIDEAWEGGDTQETVHPGLPSQRVLPRPKAKKRCVGCGGPAEMNASLGPACPDCYDDLSG
jgi:hypothetical protein